MWRSSLRSTLAVCGLLLCAPRCAFAAGPVMMGIKGGALVSNIDPKNIGNVSEFETKRGPAAGAFVVYGLGDWIGVQGEVLYVAKGTSFGKGEATDETGRPLGTYEDLQIMEYVEVPLLVRGVWPTGGALRPVLIAGPAVAFKARERRKSTGALSGSSKTSSFKNTDFGLVGGVGVELRAAPSWSLIFEGRYTHGLVNVAEDFYGRTARNRAMMIMAGVAF